MHTAVAVQNEQFKESGPAEAGPLRFVFNRDSLSALANTIDNLCESLSDYLISKKVVDQGLQGLLEAGRAMNTRLHKLADEQGES